MNDITSYTAFVAAHKPQLLLSGVPEIFWPTLCTKLQDQIFDSGAAFVLVEIDYSREERRPYDPFWSVMSITDIDKNDPSHIYLIDHAWTFKVNNIKNNLRNVPTLLERMCKLMQVSSETVDERINDVCRRVWKFANTYALESEELSVEDRIPLWYVMDELGSGIIHCDNPEFRTVPFIYIPQQVTYTLLFPIVSVEKNDVITRNFVEGNFSNPNQREAMLIPWKCYDNFEDGFEQIEPDVNYFLEGHIVESLPELDLLEKERTRIKVYSDYKYINQYLSSPEFQIVENAHEADVLWYTDHFKNFRELSINYPKKFVNQFPFEYVITVKDLLAIIARRAQTPSKNSQFDTSPPWLPTTFNMKTEMPQFVSYYMKRKNNGLDNHWICKPYNLARGLDTYITDNLDFLCRLPLSGPKIAQKYIENPVLFHRLDVGKVKFDVRYIILLKSVEPTEVYIYNNFFLRFANKPFALNDFDDYEQHFTVMNYHKGVHLYRLLCDEFKDIWQMQYPYNDWDEIEGLIFKIFSELFTAATSKAPPRGIAKSPQSRALYAADIMLSWDREEKIQPKLLEINWMPDCRRACKYYPDFYNDIFSVMFLNKEVSTCTKIL